VGLFAGILLYSIACAVSLVTVWGKPEGAASIDAPEYPGPLAGVVAIVLLWAPIVEETMFRGALLRGVRGFSRWFVSGAITAVLFALIHRPSWAWSSQLLRGFGTAFVREWRRSLVPCMIMHALFNCVPVYFLVTIFGR